MLRKLVQRYFGASRTIPGRASRANQRPSSGSWTCTVWDKLFSQFTEYLYWATSAKFQEKWHENMFKVQPNFLTSPRTFYGFHHSDRQSEHGHEEYRSLRFTTSDHRDCSMVRNTFMHQTQVQDLATHCPLHTTNVALETLKPQWDCAGGPQHHRAQASPHP